MTKLDPKKLPLGQDVEIRFIGRVFALDSNGNAGIKTPDGTIWAIPLNAKIYAADDIPGKVYFKNSDDYPGRKA